MTDLRDEIRSTFAEWTGRGPAGLWSAPGRVNLIGEHTDYNLGFVLPFAIDRRTLVAAGPRDDGLLRIASAREDEAVTIPLSQLDEAVAAGSVRGWAAYPLGVAWALGRAGADLGALPGVDILVDSTVPVGAGLSSSAALECAVAVALDELWQLGSAPADLAEAGRRAENDVVGAPTGLMDQTAAMLGRRDAAVLLDCRSREARIVPLGLAESGLSILVADTGTPHAHAYGGYRDRRTACETAAARLGIASLRDLDEDDLDRVRSELDEVVFRRVRHIVAENSRVLETVRELDGPGPSSIGDLLLASHASMRDDFEISTAPLDLAVETAVAAGAIGARMTGGGFGGSAIALVRDDDVSRVEVALDGAFAEHGLAAPTTFTVVPSDGAARED